MYREKKKSHLKAYLFPLPERLIWLSYNVKKQNLIIKQRFKSV